MQYFLELVFLTTSHIIYWCHSPCWTAPLASQSSFWKGLCSAVKQRAGLSKLLRKRKEEKQSKGPQSNPLSPFSAAFCCDNNPGCWHCCLYEHGVMKALSLLGCRSFLSSQAGGAGWLQMEKDPRKSAVTNVKAGQKGKQNAIMKVILPPNFRNLPFTFRFDEQCIFLKLWSWPLFQT